MDTSASVMMALGDYRFSLPTAAFQTLERSRAYRWEAIDRVGVRPAMQFIGFGEDSVSMDGVIYPAFRGGLRQVDNMADQAGKGEPLLLVDGMGNVWGQWCIVEIRETRTVFFSNGAPRKIEFGLTLKLYDDPKTSSSSKSQNPAVSKLATVSPPGITKPASAISSLSDVTQAPTWTKQVSATTLLTDSSARQFMPISTDGLSRVSSSITMGAQDALTAPGASTSIDGFKRAATAVTTSFSHFTSDEGIAKFASVGIDLPSVISGTPSGTLPFDAVLSAMKAAGSPTTIANAVAQDADMASVYAKLIEAAPNV